MKTIQIIINSSIDSFGTKTVIFIADQGGTFILSREEGSHEEIECGRAVCDAECFNSSDCTL